MRDLVVDRELDIQASCISLPNSEELKGCAFPEMRVISQPCLKICQQAWTMGSICQFYCQTNPQTVCFQLKFRAVFFLSCLVIKANKCFTSTSQPFTFLLQRAFSSSSADSHLCDSPPQPFSLRKACQRKSSQAEDIVERL